MSPTEASMPPIAAIGKWCRLPGADTPERYRQNLINEVESITRADDVPEDAEGRRRAAAAGKVHDAEYFDTAEALEYAGYGGDRGIVAGVFAGSGENRCFKQHLAPRPDHDPDHLSAPSITVQARCSMPLTAIALARQALAGGICEIALAGGVTLRLAAIAILRDGATPVHPTPRWSLVVHGSADALASMGARAAVAEPLIAKALRHLVAAAGDGDRDAPAADLLARSAPERATGLGGLRSRRALGLGFARTSAPEWMRPALAWHEEELPASGPAAAVAEMWNSGMRVDGHACYASEPRPRLALPTYPFSAPAVASLNPC
jgi:acyl transferase domain-containing protein